MDEISTVSSWILYFFVYSFLGWVWESCFVSFCSKKWTNRGFVRGPVLPLYGSGAVLLLLISTPFAGQPVRMYFVGLIGATVLEYVTGVVMEMLFKVRYWDYSDKPLNINGYICLEASLLWGVFAVLLNTCIHPFVARLLFAVPLAVRQGAVTVFCVLFLFDFAAALKHALRFRALLETLAVARTELSEFAEKLETSVKGNFTSARLSLSDNLDSLKNTRQISTMLKLVEQLLQKARAGREEGSDLVPDRLVQWRERFSRAIGSMTSRQKELLNNYSHTVSKKYASELEFLRSRIRRNDSDDSSEEES